MEMFGTLKRIQKGKINLPVSEEHAKQIAESAFIKGSFIFEKYVLVSILSLNLFR